MIVLTLLSEANNPIFQWVMEKAMEGHGILTGPKCTNPSFVKTFQTALFKATIKNKTLGLRSL